MERRKWNEELKCMHPIGFFSRKLTHEDLNYQIYDKEFLEIREGMEVPIT